MILGNKPARLCTIHGIRHHTGSGTELYVINDQEFNRALKARAMMDKNVPAISKDSDFPYCVWYPQVASVTPHRRPDNEYPCLKYNVARACVVAQYSELDKELELLPDVSIAEEARQSRDLGAAISPPYHELSPTMPKHERKYEND